MKKLLFILLLLGVGLTGTTYWFSLPRSPVHGDEGFRAEPVVLGDILETVSATGILFPQDSVVVGSELPGKVLKIYPNADFNRSVEEGEPLIQLDDRIARQALEEAQAGVAAAKAAVEAAKSNLAQANGLLEAARLKESRLRELAQTVGSRKEHDESLIQLRAAEAGIKAAQAGISAAEGRVESAEAARAKAQIGLDLTTIRVPTHRDSGDLVPDTKRKYIVIDRQVVLGQLIGPQMPAPLFTLASDLGHMLVYAQVAEGDVTKIKRDLDATFTIHGYGDDHRFTGKVVQIRPKPANVQGAVFFTVEVDVKNGRDPITQEWRLRPGMTAIVDISLHKHANVWKIPTKSLGFQLELEHRSEAGKHKYETWLKGRKDPDDWKAVWKLDASKKGYPYFVRIGGKNAENQVGLKDGQFNEVLEWDPELKPTPVPGNRETYPEFLVDAPPAQKSGFFNKPLKLF